MKGQSTRRKRGRYERPQLRVHRWDQAQARIVIAHPTQLLGPAMSVSLALRASVLYQTIYADAAVALCEMFTPEVLLAADLLPDGPIEQFLPALLRTGTRVVIAQSDADAAHGLRLLRSGASGLLGPDRSVEEAAEILLAVAGGESIIPGPVGEVLLAEWRTRPLTPNPRSEHALTSRELEVLTAMADGLGTKAIARHLNIALKTAENHKTRIFQKLGVGSQTEVIALLQGSNPSDLADHMPSPQDMKAFQLVAKGAK
jgi:DNA-binding NarL/FixJ family response regulator